MRFTPTCVGQTVMSRVPAWNHPVHPHVRGADGETDDEKKRHLLVHPHVRGADDPDGVEASVDQRFTPTCVGQTITAVTSTRGTSVHPHVRGADTSFTLHSHCVSISSPIPAVPFRRLGGTNVRQASRIAHKPFTNYNTLPHLCQTWIIFFLYLCVFLFFLLISPHTRCPASRRSIAACRPPARFPHPPAWAGTSRQRGRLFRWPHPPAHGSRRVMGMCA